MNKYFYQLLIFLIILISCNRPDNKETIEEFIIYGYSGFCCKDSANWIFDSTKINVRQYFEYKRDSFVRMALRSYYEKNFGFYTIYSNDTFGFNDLLDKTLLNKTFFEEYYYPKGHSMYDGYFYTMFFKTNKNKETYIHYIPNYLPDSLRILHNYFNKSLKNKPLVTCKTFEFKEMSTKEVIALFKKNPPPPPENLELRVKFTAPKKKKKDTIVLKNNLDSTINHSSHPQ